MSDFRINGVSYKSEMMDGATQLYVLKRLSPIFAALIGSSRYIPDIQFPPALPPEPTDDDIEIDRRARDVSMGAISELLMPVTRQLANMKDHDVDFILDACRNVTQRQAANGIGWVPIKQSGFVQDRNDTKFSNRLMIAWYVLSENFPDAFAQFGIDLQSVVGQAIAAKL